MLVVSSLFTYFSVSAFASGDTTSENLVDNNLTNWGQFGLNTANIRYLGNTVNYLEASGSSHPIFIFDLTEYLKIGESYRLTFRLPTTDGVNNVALNTASLLWFISDGDETPTINAETRKLVEVNKNNKSKYLGKETTYEFTYTEGYKNSFLYLTIEPNDENTSYSYLQMYISNIKLERVQSEEEGLLNSIIEWLRQIKDNLTNGFENLKNGLIELKNNIVELPGRIVNGIKNLFVPSSNYFELKMDDIQIALEENLGAVYQVSNLLDEFFTNFNADSTQNVIEVPVLSVDLLGYPFTIGGWSVPLVPDSRLQFLADACKFIIGVLTTFAFLYGLRKKYDEIVGGGED